MDFAKESLEQHYLWKGKQETAPKMAIKTKEELSVAYTPGVAAPCLEIQADIEKSYELTGRWNTVAVVTDGTAVLGLGDIGPEAGMPVVEGKCVLFKTFGNVDAIPLCIRSKDPDEIVRVIELLAGSFGGINLEDISAPRCFQIESRLKESCDIPIFHDDQHGTAVAVLAALINALKTVDKRLEKVNIVINGAGAAGIAVAKLLIAAKAENIIMCDRIGAIHKDRDNLNSEKIEISKVTNKLMKSGTLAEVIRGADVFIGVSAPKTVTCEMIKTMADNPIIFALANPVPEIMPDEATKAGAAIVCTGRSDFPNQINNLLVFPGIFRGALDARASDINEDMKMAAAHALAGIIADNEINADNVLPSVFNERILTAVSNAVKEAAFKTGVSRLDLGEN